MQKFINEYYAISVREPSAVKMVKQLSIGDCDLSRQIQ